MTVGFHDLGTADLTPGAVLPGGDAADVGADPIAPAFGVGNQGGIRPKAPTTSTGTGHIVLFSRGDHPDWPDHIDPESKLVRYYGDNRSPDRTPHEAKGNARLRDVWAIGFDSRSARLRTPPIFVVSSDDLPGRSVCFRGLAVPGHHTVEAWQSLSSGWRGEPSSRFENYVVHLTLLDTGTVPRSWIDALATKGPASPDCPPAYRAWLDEGLLEFTAPGSPGC